MKFPLDIHMVLTNSGEKISAMKSAVIYQTQTIRDAWWTPIWCNHIFFITISSPQRQNGKEKPN